VPGRPKTADVHAESCGAATGWPSVVVAAAVFALLLGANLPTPLYGIYRERFGMSATVMTLIFATYAVVLIPSLMVFGQLSDRVGRKPVILAALTVAALGLLLLAAARGTVWLFAARAAQGLAVGSASATATAALVELDPDHDESRAALRSVIGQAGGAATAPLLAGALAQWAPWRLTLCYLVGLTLTVVVAFAASRLPQDRTPSRRWRLQRPSVPAEVRSQFALASITGMCVWVVGALFLSVVPSYTAELLDVSNLALLALPTTTMLMTACIAHALSLHGPQSPPRLQLTGLVLLVTGVLLLVLAWPLRSFAILLVAGVVAGGALGLGFGGSQTQINQLAPEDSRGELTAAYIMIVYAGIAAVSLLVGQLGDAFGIPQAVAVIAGGLGVGAIGTAWLRLDERPTLHARGRAPRRGD
jgi:MFS family permease